MTARIVVTCAACGDDRPHHGRNLCQRCYCRHDYHGTLDRYPPLGRRPVWLDGRIEDYDELRRQGLSIQRAAERLGVTERTGWRYERVLREQRRAA